MVTKPKTRKAVAKSKPAKTVKATKAKPRKKTAAKKTAAGKVTKTHKKKVTRAASTKATKHKTTTTHKATKQQNAKQAKNDKTFSAYSDKQKSELLLIIAKIIKLHKSDKNGLKSLTEVDRILDQYNQKYTRPEQKFDAILRYGLAENPANLHRHMYVLLSVKDKETTDFFKWLSQIGTGKLRFDEAKSTVEKMFSSSFEARNKMTAS